MMTFTRPILAAALLGTLAACTTDPYTGRQTIARSGVGALGGAAGGALLGTLVGGRHSRTETILGAGIGALGGAAVGSYMDRQEARLRQQTAGTGIDVVRQGDDVLLRMPSAITFDTNSYLIQPRFQGTLDEVARTLADYPQTFVDVYGYTDSTGGPAINGPLSENRARAVADYLSGHGVVAARIGVRGMAEQMPIASNVTPDGRQRNRRVEIKLSPVTEGDVRGG